MAALPVQRKVHSGDGRIEAVSQVNDPNNDLESIRGTNAREVSTESHVELTRGGCRWERANFAHIDHMNTSNSGLLTSRTRGSLNSSPEEAPINSLPESHR